jgi:hypothetical protein
MGILIGYNWNVLPNPLLDAVKTHLKLTTDRQLAKALEVLPSGISKVRKSGRIPPEWIILIHKRTKWPIERIEFLIDGIEVGR